MSTKTGITLFIAFALLWVVVMIAFSGGFSDAGIIAPIFLLILVIVSGLACIICSFVLLISAFKQDITTGLLFLFIPFYSLYYAITVYREPNKGTALTGWLGGGAVLSIVSIIGYYSMLSEIGYF